VDRQALLFVPGKVFFHPSTCPGNLGSNFQVIHTEGRLLWPYSQHFIFFTTLEWVQQARALHNIRAERLSMDKYSKLLYPFVSYEENYAL
jgi:hypothetical protein